MLKIISWRCLKDTACTKNANDIIQSRGWSR